jgi:hypothetical protein
MRALLLMALFASTADAKRRPPPLTKSERAAQQVAEQWIAAMHFGGGAQAATPLTHAPFYSVAVTEETTPCAEATATTKAAIAGSLACLHDHIAPKGAVRLWHRTLGGPLAAQLEHLTVLAKGAIVFELDEGCDGTSNQTLVVVQGPQVKAVLSQVAACTE